jgi:hypothetical protein
VSFRNRWGKLRSPNGMGTLPRPARKMRLLPQDLKSLRK